MSFTATSSSWAFDSLSSNELGGVTDYSVVDFFIHYQIPIVIVLMIVFGVTVPLFSKMWDKHESANGLSDDGNVCEKIAFTAESLGVPRFYALFLLLPLFIILIFSGLFSSAPNISVGAAHWICLIQLINHFLKGMGNYLAMGGMIMVGAALFADALIRIGGMANHEAQYISGRLRGFGRDCSLPDYGRHRILIGGLNNQQITEIEYPEEDKLRAEARRAVSDCKQSPIFFRDNRHINIKPIRKAQIETGPKQKTQSLVGISLFLCYTDV